MLSERIERLKKRYFGTRQSITAERLVLATEAYQKYAGESIPIFRARVFEYVLDRMTVMIWDDELIVGNEPMPIKAGCFIWNMHPRHGYEMSWMIFRFGQKIHMISVLKTKK